MKDDDVLKKIKIAIRQNGGQAKLAEKWGCTQASISMALKYRPFSDKLCELAGIRKSVVYTQAE